MIGVIIVATAGDLNQLLLLTLNPGDLAMFIGFLFYAGYIVALQDRPNASPSGLFGLHAIVAFFTCLPWVAEEMVLGKFQWPSPNRWVIIFLTGMFPSFLAQIFFIKGVSIIGPRRAGVFVNFVPVFASVLAVIILDEPFEAFHPIALGLVLSGIAVAERGKPGS